MPFARHACLSPGLELVNRNDSSNARRILADLSANARRPFVECRPTKVWRNARRVIARAWRIGALNIAGRTEVWSASTPVYRFRYAIWGSITTTSSTTGPLQPELIGILHVCKNFGKGHLAERVRFELPIRPTMRALWPRRAKGALPGLHVGYNDKSTRFIEEMTRNVMCTRVQLR
jgi:hypothetical protein